MKYNVDTLKIGNDKSIDIPEGCIPVKYDCSIERRYPKASLVRTLTILRPIEDKEIKKDIEYIEDKEIKKDIEYIEDKEIKKDIEEKCFFCKKNDTRDKVGIMPICPICLGELYGLARESHKSQEC